MIEEKKTAYNVRNIIPKFGGIIILSDCFSAVSTANINRNISVPNLLLSSKFWKAINLPTRQRSDKYFVNDLRMVYED